MLMFFILSGILSTLLWVIGDILLVGFDTDTHKYESFHQWMDGDPQSSYYLKGSEKRLRLGALIASLSTPLVVFRYFALYLLASPFKIATFFSILFFISSTLYPLAHASFYYVGTISNYAFKKFQQGEGEEELKKVIRGYKKMQTYAWTPAILICAIAWLGYTILIFMGKTLLPFWMGIFSPVLIYPLFELLRRLPYPGKPLFNGAGFNIAEFCFFFPLLIWKIFT
ncbi:MAG: hypothetical protein Q4P25_03610 [Tissierellia bacterium]|nr:hypothetical protein [Tissierellia bacterium]